MIKAVLFDTFGTIVDWRSSIARESAVFAKAHEIVNFDGDGFARTWRAGYRPGMAKVTTGKRPWVSIDVIHRERLDEILPQFGLSMLDEAERDHLNRAWHCRYCQRINFAFVTTVAPYRRVLVSAWRHPN